MSAVVGNGFDGHFAGFRGVRWGISLGLEGRQGGRYEADSDAERPAAGQSAVNAGPERVRVPRSSPRRRSCCRCCPSSLELNRRAARGCTSRAPRRPQQRPLPPRAATDGAAARRLRRSAVASSWSWRWLRPDQAGLRAVAARSIRSQRCRESALTGVAGGTPGYPRGAGRPSAGRCEADVDGERPADGHIAGE